MSSSGTVTSSTALNSVGNQSIAVFTQLAAAAITDQAFFIAPYACTVQACDFVYGTAAGATSTVTVTHETTTGAAGTGTAILAAAVNMNTTINTVVRPTLATGPIVLIAGDRLSTHVASGTASASAGVVIQVYLTRN